MVKCKIWLLGNNQIFLNIVIMKYSLDVWDLLWARSKISKWNL